MFTPLQNLLTYRVVLASGSPRRHELLKLLNIDFIVDTSVDVKESYPFELPVREVAPYLSKLKAQAHKQKMQPDDLIITADTVVLLDNRVIGKPDDAEEAKLMLHRLSGREHEVVTGVTILTQETQTTFKASSTVDFAHLTDKEIEYYVDKYHPLDKAGAYGIQEWIGAVGIRAINGSFYNVMGLPVHLLYNQLALIPPRS